MRQATCGADLLRDGLWSRQADIKQAACHGEWRKRQLRSLAGVVLGSLREVVHEYSIDNS